MRVYGRIYNENGTYTWQEVTTDSNGYNDYVYITALIQCLKLNINESPFWANWGIPGFQSVAQQIFPDFYVMLMQQRFAGYFASLKITKLNLPTPTYNVAIVTNQGVAMQMNVPV